jgi:ribonuclease-3
MTEWEQRRSQLEQLTRHLNVQVEDWELLNRALTHASASGDPSGPSSDYEALEFVGDAVLGLAVTRYLYDCLPDRTPGEYSKMRAAVVNQRTLARVAVELDIAPAIRLGKGEERSGGRQRMALLAECLEAVIGVLYLDQGWEAARAFVYRTFERELYKAQSLDRVWDYKSRLQHYCQAGRIELPEFMLVSTEGPDHQKRFEVEVWLRGGPAGRGWGSSKKEAEQNAARAALEIEGQSLG